ncbi:MAG: 2Fe-2S iron-sulfur cluster binding domain-containing protein [Gammaproteobacteria bacterium]|nr:2Fe-2S iron-sulfur cluster binding domain-containing protein [Gammaproteobacteria bacterium]
MLSYHPLRLRRVVHDPAGATRLWFDVPAELADAFRYRPGQYVGLRATIAGRDTRRTYSICGAPEAGAIELCVKRVPGGEMSQHLAATVREGDVMDVLTPQGRFSANVDPAQTKTYVFFAAGSGITPVISNLRAILAAEPGSRAILCYGNRTAAEVLFNEELQALKDRHMTRLALHFFFSREPQHVALYDGRLDASKVQALLASVIPASEVDEFYVCGPLAMNEEIVAALRAAGVHGDRVKIERFGVPRPGTKPAAPAAPVEDTGPIEVELTQDGRVRRFHMHEHETLLEAAERHHFALPFSCRAGVCATCRCRATKGSVAMHTNYALERWELDAGFILTCQAKPKTPQLAITYDEK